MSCSLMRLNNLRAVMQERAWAGFMVRNTSDIAWLTAFDGVFDEERAHCLTVTADDALLHTDSRYVTACEQAAKGGSIVVDGSRRTHLAAALDLLAPEGRPFTGTLAIQDDIALGEYRRLEKDLSEHDAWQGTLAETDGVIVGLRRVKDEGEIARMRAAQAITDAAFSYIVDYMLPGMTEREVQLELDDYMLRHGAEGLAFPSIVATGPNGAKPHSIPGHTVLEAGQCVVMDFGARAKGYCSDMTRTVFLGEPDEELRHAWEVLRQANEQVESMLRPGVTGKEAHESAERVLADGGFEGRMGHGLGHGVGIDIHEEPVLSPRNEKPLVPGNVVTVEPGIYLPGKFGMRLEDFGVITDDGFEVFTQSTHDLIIL